MVDYTKAKIYAIKSSQTKNVYIGSTCEPILSRRLAGHVLHYRHYQKGKYHYVSSFDILQFKDYKIELIESFSCSSKDELLQREGYWITNTPNCINKHVTGRTPQETQKIYAFKNSDKIKIRQKRYTNMNSEKIKINRKQYYENNKLELGAKKICAVCCRLYKTYHKSMHNKTDYHNWFIDLNNQIVKTTNEFNKIRSQTNLKDSK